MSSPIVRHTNIIAAFLVLIKDGQTLLQKRMNTGYHDGDYGMVSGHVEAGETYTQAIVREAQEEANLTLSPVDLRVCHVMHRKSSVDGSERVDVYFTAKKWSGEPKNMEIHKCEELRWFPVDSLPANVIPYVNRALDCIAKSECYSEYGW